MGTCGEHADAATGQGTLKATRVIATPPNAAPTV